MSQHQGNLRQRTKNNVQTSDFAKYSFHGNFLSPDQSPLLSRTRGRRRRRRTRDAKDVYISYILVFCTTSVFVFLFLHWPRSNAVGKHLFQHAYHTEIGSTYHKKLRQIHVKRKSKGEKIICEDGSTGIINDNFCDCPDGADELETAACSHILVQQRLFDCGDGTKIYLSRLADGVLDCSNGADEVKSGFMAS